MALPFLQSIPTVASLASRARSAAGRVAAALPFGGGSQAPANAPRPNYRADQPPPPPTRVDFRAGYHDHSYQAQANPIAFEGFDLDRIRNAIALHRTGFFLESWQLAIAVIGYGPVMAALGQRVAPLLGLPREVSGFDKGISRVVAEEVRDQLARAKGSLPSPMFPPEVWGATAISLALMGFSVWQHVYGDPDENGVRPVYTRWWPTWAVRYEPFRRTFVALTTEENVDIVTGDGKFTLIADSVEPHLLGAILAIAEEAADGKSTKRNRARLIDRYTDPKLWGTMPEKLAVDSPEGQAFYDALQTIRGPGGFGLGPHGATLNWTGLKSLESSLFDSGLSDVWRTVAAALLGTPGTMGNGDAGHYESPHPWGVRHDLVSRDVGACVRGANMGHVEPYVSLNYSATRDEKRRQGLWKDPVFDIPLPDEERDARVKSYTERRKALTDQIKADRESGMAITQEYIDALAERYEVDPPTLADVASGAEVFGYDLAGGVVWLNEQRVRKGEKEAPWGNCTQGEHDRRIAAGWATSSKGWVKPDGTLHKDGDPGPAPTGETSKPVATSTPPAEG